MRSGLSGLSLYTEGTTAHGGTAPGTSTGPQSTVGGRKQQKIKRKSKVQLGKSRGRVRCSWEEGCWGAFALVCDIELAHEIGPSCAEQQMLKEKESPLGQGATQLQDSANLGAAPPTQPSPSPPSLACTSRLPQAGGTRIRAGGPEEEEQVASHLLSLAPQAGTCQQARLCGFPYVFE